MIADNQNKKPQKSPNKFLRFASAGIQIGITIWLGNEFGKWLDIKFDKDYLEPVITLLSIFISIYLVIVQVMKISEKDD
jgi:membrane protein DedA with SNARE-associated domain